MRRKKRDRALKRLSIEIYPDNVVFFFYREAHRDDGGIDSALSRLCVSCVYRRSGVVCSKEANPKNNSNEEQRTSSEDKSTVRLES